MTIAKRRRREAKTNYLKRMKLLKGNSPRVVFRKTNRNVIAQYVTSKEAQDRIEIGINSKILLKYGWPKGAEKSLKTIPASYLTGFILGKKILNEKKKVPIMDFGMIRNLHKTKIYAFVKGLIDSGLKIKVDKKKDIFPDESRIKGESMKNKIPFEEILNRISDSTKSRNSKDFVGKEIKSKIEEEK